MTNEIKVAWDRIVSVLCATYGTGIYGFYNSRFPHIVEARSVAVRLIRDMFPGSTIDQISGQTTITHGSINYYARWIRDRLWTDRAFADRFEAIEKIINFAMKYQ